MDGQLGPWAVAGPALEYGIRALGDHDWQSAMRTTLAREAARLDALFARFGIVVAGGTTLFRYLSFAGAATLFSVLGHAGILLRHFTDRPHVLRSGLPGSDLEWERLEAALDGWARADDAMAREMKR